MVESVEENEGVAIFLPFFGEKCVLDVEENEGVAIFLYMSRQTPIDKRNNTTNIRYLRVGK